MKTINIHLEGQGEIRFFSLLIKEHFDFNFRFQGKQSINMVYKSESLTINLRHYNLESKEGGISSAAIRRLLDYLKVSSVPKKEYNVLIIDADTENHKHPKGGYEERKKYLENLKQEFQIDFQYFIIPDNSNSGNLEDVLDRIISAKGLPFYNCLKNYTTCITNLSETNYPIEVLGKDMKKKKFEWYSFMMLGQKHKRETGLSKTNYSNDLWDLKSATLNPLLNFLREVLR